jgi:hypothetical protein
MSHQDAVTFAQVILGLLVFTLGVPALAVSSLEGRIRHLLHKHHQYRDVTWLLLVSGLAVMFLLFAPSKLQPTGEAILSPTMTLAATATTLAMIALFAVYWIVSVRTDVRTRLIHDIERHVRDVVIQGMLSTDEDVDDLVLIGECGAAGYEKGIVIAAIGSLCEYVQSRTEYAGRGLRPLLYALRRIVTTEERPGGDENFRASIEIVRNCWSRLTIRDVRASPDHAALIDTISGIGQCAIRHSSDMVALACLDAVPRVAQSAFRIGTAALAADNFPVVVGVLSRLEALARDASKPSSEFLALLAMLSRRSELGAEVALDVLTRCQYSEQDLRLATVRASKDFLLAGDFTTAELLRAQPLHSDHGKGTPVAGMA